MHAQVSEVEFETRHHTFQCVLAEEDFIGTRRVLRVAQPV